MEEKRLFMAWTVKRWSKFLRQVVVSPFLEMLKTQLDNGAGKPAVADRS